MTHLSGVNCSIHHVKPALECGNLKQRDVAPTNIVKIYKGVAPLRIIFLKTSLHIRDKGSAEDLFGPDVLTLKESILSDCLHAPCFITAGGLDITISSSSPSHCFILVYPFNLDILSQIKV